MTPTTRNRRKTLRRPERPNENRLSNALVRVEITREAQRPPTAAAWPGPTRCRAGQARVRGPGTSAENLETRGKHDALRSSRACRALAAAGGGGGRANSCVLGALSCEASHLTKRHRRGAFFARSANGRGAYGYGSIDSVGESKELDGHAGRCLTRLQTMGSIGAPTVAGRATLPRGNAASLRPQFLACPGLCVCPRE